jgi:hypothetical protein
MSFSVAAARLCQFFRAGNPIGPPNGHIPLVVLQPASVQGEMRSR